MKFKRIAMWVISIIMGLMFLYAGGSKLAADKMHVDAFNRWGIPLWFMYVTGVVEVTAGILILIPKTRFWGAALLVGTMVGALIIQF